MAAARRYQAATKPLQSKDLFLNLGSNKLNLGCNKKAIGAPGADCLGLFRPLFRTAKPRPAVGILPGRRLRLP